MKKFNLPEVEVVSFKIEDIICTSGGGAGAFFGELHTNISAETDEIEGELDEF